MNEKVFDRERERFMTDKKLTFSAYINANVQFTPKKTQKLTD